MLIYDHNKTFIGIDDEDLKHLGFATAATLFEHCSDFADLFVKRPGYIHNFKNFAWIDFVLHAEAEDSKAIIHTPGKNFSCTLQIKPFHLASAPNQEAYAIQLHALKALNEEQNAQIAHDLSAHPTPMAGVKPVEMPAENTFSKPDIALPDFENMPAEELNEPDIFDVPVDMLEPETIEAPEAFKLDIDDVYAPSQDPIIEEPVHIEAPEPEEDKALAPEVSSITDDSLTATPKRSNLPDIPMLGDQLSHADKAYIDNLQVDKEYHYNPQIAADELGLPVDLIEEFIGDFIQQAHDFHDPLFDACNSNDMDNIKTLSHKLKGVAANLRIEDTFEVLSIVNTSSDIDEISANLKYFYHLISKLEGKESSEIFADLEEIESSTASTSKSFEEESTVSAEPFEDIPPEEHLEPSIAVKQDNDDEIYPFEMNTDEAPEVLSKATTDDSQVDDIYPFDMPATDTFDIPQQPPLLDDESVDIKDNEQEELLDLDMEPLDLLDETNDASEVIAKAHQAPEEKIPVKAAASAEAEASTTLVDDAPLMAYDRLKVANELGLPENLVSILVKDFKDETLNQASAFKDAIASFEPQQWKQIAKELKGISDNLRCDLISYELQTLSATNDAQMAKVSLDKLIKLINQL